MDISKINLNSGQLLIETAESENKTESGLILEENTDDFLVYGKIVLSSSSDYFINTQVIFHVLDSETLRDAGKVFSLVRDDKIRGVYGEN